MEELDTEKPEKRNYEHFQMMSQPVMHTPASLAYRFTGRSGKGFVYSGDTGFCDEIITLAQGTDLFITECSFPDGEGKEGHLTPSLAGRIATLADVKKLLLVHFYPEVLESRLGRDCRKTFPESLFSQGTCCMFMCKHERSDPVIPVDQAVGRVSAYCIAEISPGQFKGPACNISISQGTSPGFRRKPESRG